MTQLRRISCLCLTVLLSLVAGLTPAVAADSTAEGLVRAMPEDAILFVASGGGDAVKGDFEKSIVGRIWNDPGVQGFYRSVKTQVLAKMQQEAGDPNESGQMDMAMGLARLVASRPVALGLAPLKGPARDKELPPIYGFAIIEAGARKAELEAAVKQVESLIGVDQIVDATVGSAKMRRSKHEDDTPLYWGWSGNYLVVAINDADGLALQSLQKPRAAVAACLRKAPGGGNTLIVHANVQKAVNVIETLARQAEDAEAADAVTTALRELGLSGVKTWTVRAGFAGSEVVAGCFLEAPEPRTGLLTVLKPLDPTMMDMVDAQAVKAGTANIDAAGIYDTIMRTIKAVAGEDYADVEKGLAAFEAETGVSIRGGLESLAGPVAFYSVGMGVTPEAPMGGVVGIVRLKDAAVFEKMMASLGKYVAAQSDGKLQVGSQTRDDGRTVHTWVIPQLAMMQVMPTWAVTNGCAVIGSNPAVCDAAFKQVASTGRSDTSIRNAAGYKEAVSRLPGNLTSLSYTDSKVQYTQAMTMLQQFWPMATMMASQNGLTLPSMLPSLSHIIKDMKPSCRWSWTAPDGLYTQCRGDGIEMSLTSVAGVSIGLGVAMPALARSRQLALRMTSATNLSSIGKACLIYANDHDDKLPPNLEALVGTAELSPKTLESKLKPKDFDGPSYIYIPGQTAEMNPGNVVAYDNPAFCVDGLNVLFLDSHVEFMKPDEFRRELKETCERLGRPMPEIRFKGQEKSPATMAPPGEA